MTLHVETVAPGLFALLGRVMANEVFDAFTLGGGTSLALRFGHRESVDIDLFTDQEFDPDALAGHLKDQYGMVEAATATNTVRGIIDGIKVDFLAHRYPLLSEVETVRGIRMLSLEDISAMKLNAIANRGSKKDFWDFAELLSRFSREEMLGFYARKYPQDSLWNVEKSLGYFVDAEVQPDPRDHVGRTWSEVKRIIEEQNRL